MKILILISFTVLSIFSYSQNYVPDNVYSLEYSEEIGRQIGDIIYLDEKGDTTNFKDHSFYLINTTTNYFLKDINLTKISIYYESGRLKMTGYRTNIDSLDLVGLKTAYKKNGKVLNYDLFDVNKSLDLFPKMKQYISKLKPCDENYLILSVEFEKHKTYIGYRKKDFKSTCTMLVLDNFGEYTEISLENGFREGEVTAFNRNNVLKILGSFKNDKKDGVWKYYNKKGKLKKEILFKDGNVIEKIKH